MCPPAKKPNDFWVSATRKYAEKHGIESLAPDWDALGSELVVCVCVYIDDMTWWNSSVMMGFWGYKRHKKGMICVSQVKRFSTSCVQGPNGWLAGFVFMLGEGGGGDPSNLVETCNRCPFHIDVLLVSMVFLGGTSKIRSWFRFLHDVI